MRSSTNSAIGRGRRCGPSRSLGYALRTRFPEGLLTRGDGPPEALARRGVLSSAAGSSVQKEPSHLRPVWTGVVAALGAICGPRPDPTQVGEDCPPPMDALVVAVSGIVESLTARRRFGAGDLASRVISGVGCGPTRSRLTRLGCRVADEVGSHFSGWVRCWVRVWARR